MIAPERKAVERPGIGIFVRGILIRYEWFGLHTAHKIGAGRITGRVHADFLPITSNRDDFIHDTVEYDAFYAGMKREVGKALQVISKETDFRANLQASRVLKHAMDKIGRAMKRCANAFPHTPVPLPPEGSDPDARLSQDGEGGEHTQSAEEGYVISDAHFFVPTGSKLPEDMRDRIGKNAPPKGQQRTVVPIGDKSVIRNLRIGSVAMAVRLEHLGGDDESVLSGGIIYVNLDHPLYRTYQHDDHLLTAHMARILTKELTLTSGITDAERAFALQSELLTYALQERGKK